MQIASTRPRGRPDAFVFRAMGVMDLSPSDRPRYGTQPHGNGSRAHVSATMRSYDNIRMYRKGRWRQRGSDDPSLFGGRAQSSGHAHMTEYVDQAVRQIRADGVSLRRTTSRQNAVGELEDGTPLRRVGGILDVGSGDRRGYVVCQLIGHRFDGKRMVTWADEETPAIECTRCRLVRARPPSGASLEGGTDAATDDTGGSDTDTDDTGDGDTPPALE